MVRLVAVALVASMSILGAIAPGGKERGKPPSSLEPGAPRGKLTLSHQSQRLVACVERLRSGELSCEPQREDSQSGTQLTLKPVSESGTLSREARRAEVRVRFEDAPSPQTEEIELGVGLWEVHWSGLETRPRFRVADEDEFSVELLTVAGSCKKAANRCVVSPAGQTRKTVIPARYQAR